MTIEDYYLVADPLDSHTYYDWMGNRYVFHTRKEYQTARLGYLIEWLTGKGALRFL